MPDDLSSGIPDALRNGSVVIGLFAVLALVAGVGTALLLGGDTSDLVWALAGGVGITAVVVGSYYGGRRIGQPHSHATATAGVLFGLVMSGAVVADLLYASGTISNTEIGLGLVAAVVGAVVIIGLIGAVDRATAA